MNKSLFSKWLIVLVILIFSCDSQEEQKDIPSPLICLEDENDRFPWLVDQEIKFSICSIHSNNVVWNFGDSTTSTELNPTHTYKKKGRYAVTLTVKSNGVKKTITDSITVLQPAKIKIVSGNKQSGPPEETLKDPVVVSVTDLNNQPLDSVAVKFSPEQGTNVSVAFTNSQGLAASKWILGDVLGNQTLKASIDNPQMLSLEDSFVTFEAVEILFYMSLDINGKNHYFDKNQGNEGYTRNKIYRHWESENKSTFFETQFYCEFEPFVHGVFFQFQTRQGCSSFTLEESTYQFGEGQGCQYVTSTSGVNFWADPYLNGKPCNEGGGHVSYASDTKGLIISTKVTDKYAEGTFSFTQTQQGVRYEVTNGHSRAPICAYALSCF